MVQGLSLFVCDAETSAIGCNAELNELIEIFIIIILVITFILNHTINGLCGLRLWLRLWLRLLSGIHIAVGLLVACIGLLFDPAGSIFFVHWPAFATYSTSTLNPKP